MRLHSLVVLLAATCLCAVALSPAVAVEEPQTPPPTHIPRVTLVLSGGGARGAAHIGVLRVLEEMRIPVERIVGTSMGSIVGGLYATGWSPDEIDDLFVTTDFRSLFIDHPDRDDKSFRRKQDDVRFLIPLKLRFRGFKPYLPPGAVGGQRLETLLDTLELESTDEDDFDAFPIPYRAVAADLSTGEAVVIGSGSLATAMRASMSIAGVFEPVTLEGRALVDGGAAANLPVGIAQDLGAEAIIAVDISSPLADDQTLTSLFSIFNQLTGFLTVGNRTEDIARLHPGDVLITPELGDISFTSFDRAGEAIQSGETAARAAMSGLERFSVSEEEYEAFQARHHRRPIEQAVPAAVRIENSSWVDDEIVKRGIHALAGEPLDIAGLKRDIRRLHALEYFGTIRARLDDPPGSRALTVYTPLKRYGRNSLQFGVDLYDDFQGDAGYAVSIRHQLLAVNRRGGEWQNIAQMGDTTLLESSFYQPLDYDMKWFVEPAASTQQWSQLIWSDGDPFVEYRLARTLGRVDAGRVFGRWGEARVGAFTSYNTAELRTGLPVFPDFHQKDGGLQFRFRVDTRDDAVFPQHGLTIDASYTRTNKPLGADIEYSSYRTRVSGAFTFGRNTIVPVVESGSVLEGEDFLSNL